MHLRLVTYTWEPKKTQPIPPRCVTRFKNGPILKNGLITGKKNSILMKILPKNSSEKVGKKYRKCTTIKVSELIRLLLQRLKTLIKESNHRFLVVIDSFCMTKINTKLKSLLIIRT